MREADHSTVMLEEGELSMVVIVNMKLPDSPAARDVNMKSFPGCRNEEDHHRSRRPVATLALLDSGDPDTP